MQSKTYSDLLALVQALAGVDSFTSAEQTKILAMANRRLYQAYASSPTWPRYIKNQARPANDGLVTTEYDEATGVRTGSAEIRSSTTVTIVCTAAVDFAVGMSVTISGLSGSVDPNGTYPVASISTTTVTNDTFTYELDTTDTTSETYTGTATVTPVAIPDIADFIRIYDGNQFSATGANEYDFWTDSSGAHLVGDFDGLSSTYVTFKMQWPGPYLSSATDIPFEFFQFAAHATYADFLRMDGQVDKALAEESERAAQVYLALEIERAAQSKNNNLLYSRIRTHVSQMNR